MAPPSFTPFHDGQYSVLMDDLTLHLYLIDETRRTESPPGLARREFPLPLIDVTIVVPAGFVTDFASTPRWIWAVLPPFGTYQLAAVLHDFLYWDQGCTREQADEWFRIAMHQSDVNPVERDMIWETVRKGAAAAWASNAAAKAAGQPRIIPKEYRQIPPSVTWLCQGRPGGTTRRLGGPCLRMADYVTGMGPTGRPRCPRVLVLAILFRG